MGKLGNQLKSLFVGDISTSVKESELRRLFASCGTVQHVRIQRHSATGMSLGYAFIRMSNNAEAIAARTALDGTLLGGRRIRVREAIQGLPGAIVEPFERYGVHFSFQALSSNHDTNETIVRALFEQYGLVRDVSIRHKFWDKVRHTPSPHALSCHS